MKTIRLRQIIHSQSFSLEILDNRKELGGM